MATKNIETKLTIKAIDQYSGMLKNMRTVTGRFADGVRSEMKQLQGVRGSLKLIQDFKSTQATSDKAREAFERQKLEIRRLRDEMRKSERPTQAMSRAFEQARKKADRLRDAHAGQSDKLREVGGRLREAGINTADLGGEQRRLSSALDNSSEAFSRQMDRMRRLEAMQNRIAEARERMNRTLSTAANLSFVGNASMQTGRRIIDIVSGSANRAGDLQEKFFDFQNLTGIDDGRLSKLRDELDSLRDVTGQTVGEMLDGLGVLVGKGMDFEDALAALPAAGRAAKATKTSFDQMGASGFALYDNLKVAPEELRKAFDIMAMAGKEGGFELSAMARKFPEITAGARALKMEGLDSVAQLTAALQVAMKSAGSEDQAATNLSNFLGKITSPETVRRFAKMGVSIEDELRKAAENGVSPFEHMLEVIDDLTGGDALKMGELFGDKQVLDFLRAMIPNLEEYRRIRDAASAADGVVDEDHARVMATFNEQKKQLGDGVRRLFTPPPESLETLTAWMERLDAIVKRVNDWKKAHPKLTKWIFIGAGALGAMAIAGGALLTAAAGLIGAIAVLRFGLAGFGARATFAAGEFAGLGRRVRGVSRLNPTFRRPNLAGHLADFADFRLGAVGHIETLERRHNRAMRSMRRQRRRLLVGGVIAGGLTSLAMRNLPDNPENLAEFQENNVRSMDRFFRNTPGISHLIEGYERSFEWFHKKPPPVEPTLLPNEPGVRSAADIVYQFAGEENLPTAERIAHLREEVEAYREEVEAAKAALEATPEFGVGITNPLRVQAQGELDAAEAGLRRAEDRLKSAEAASAQLTKALQVLNGTEVAPKISTASIDRALAKVQQLADGIQALPSGGSGEPPSPKPAGARADGGPVRSGLPYLVNEDTPRSEWFVPSRSGGILNVGQAQSAFRSYLTSIGPRQMRRPPSSAAFVAGASRVRAASLAALSASAVALPAEAPAAAGKVGGRDVRVEINGGINVQVPSGVADPEFIADLVLDRVGDRVSGTIDASFSD